MTTLGRLTWAAHTLAALTLCALTPGLSLAAHVTHRPRHDAPPAHTITGSYERHFRGRFSGSLDIQELPGGRVRFLVVALGQVLSPNGPTMSDVSGVVPLRRGAAFFQQGDGRLALRFQGRRVVVSEYGEMGFALGVTAAGTYTRRSRVPAFKADSIDDAP